MVLARAEEMRHDVPQQFKKPPYLTVSVGNGPGNRCGAVGISIGAATVL